MFHYLADKVLKNTHTDSHLANLPIFSPAFLTMQSFQSFLPTFLMLSTTLAAKTVPMAAPAPSARLNSPVVTKPTRSSSSGTSG